MTKLNMPSLICEGTMRAAVEILHRRGFDADLVDLNVVIREMRIQIKDGYDEAVRDTKEALDAMGEPMARATLSASCKLFAARALRAAGVLEATNA